MIDLLFFSDSLKRHRKAAGLTQTELARRLSVTPQSVSRWERGEAIPDIEHLAELARILHASLDALVLNRAPGTRGLIGIDAGGTKTEFVLTDLSGTVLNRAVLEKANPNAGGIENTVRIARQGIRLLRPEGVELLGIYFGGAGMTTGNYAEVLTTDLRRVCPAAQVFCGSDAMNVVACAPDPGSCIAVISGTGSVVYLSSEGRLKRFGGGGYFFDGAGAGFEIGRDAVSAVLKADDGVGEPTLLTEFITAELGGPLWEHIHELYAQGISRVAAFAPLVSRAAVAGDPVALGILRRSADYLAGLIGAASRRAPQVTDLLLCGSILRKDELMRGMLTEKLPAHLRVILPEVPPVFGAVLACARLLNLPELPKQENFLRSY